MNSENSAAASADRLPEDFARRFLESREAILEHRADGYLAALPDSLAAALEVPDLIHLDTVSGSSAAPPAAAGPVEPPSWTVHYGSTLLDRMVALACKDIPLLTWEAHFTYIKRQGFDRLIAEQFSFPNAVGRVESQADVRTHYLLLTCFYRVQSDEQKDGLIALAFNLETGACVPVLEEDAIRRVERTAAAVNPAAAYGTARLERILRQAAVLLNQRITAETAAFTASMRRRFRRDAGNLEDYYRSLADEMRQSLMRPGLSPDLIDERRAKIQLIPDELARKQDDLLKKYSVRINVRPATVLLVNTDAVKLLFRLSIGKSRLTRPLIYNPLTKAMDPLVCEGCGMPTYHVTACGRPHLLCPACSAGCPLCRPAA